MSRDIIPRLHALFMALALWHYGIVYDELNFEQNVSQLKVDNSIYKGNRFFEVFKKDEFIFYRKNLECHDIDLTVNRWKDLKDTNAIDICRIHSDAFVRETTPASGNYMCSSLQFFPVDVKTAT